MDDPTALELRDDRDTLIPAVPEATFVRLARALRDEQRLDLVLPHATPEQLQACFDLDAWNKDRVDVPKAREWLVNIVEHIQPPNRGELAELMMNMDPEMWTFSTMHATAVAELDPEDDQSRQLVLDQMSALETYETPDGYFIVGVPDSEVGRAALRVIEKVYDDDLAGGRKLVMSIKWGVASQIEEELYRFRLGRLADMGFPTWEEAMRLFRPLPRNQAVSDDGPGLYADKIRNPAQGLPSAALREADLLRRVMARFSEREYGDATREFLLLTNELMAAQRFEPGDEAMQERAVHQLQATLSLGLAYLVASRGDDSDQAVEAFLEKRVRALGLRKVFQTAYGPLAKLRKTALALHGSGRISLSETGSLLDRPWGPSVKAASSWLPELALSQGTGTRPIQTLQDLALATRRLGEAGALAELCFGYRGFDVSPVWVTRADEPERLRLGNLIRSVLIHRARAQSTGRDPGPFAPLLPEDVDWAAKSLLRGGTIKPSVVEDLQAKLQELELEEHAEALVPNLINRLGAELAGLEYDKDDQLLLQRTGGLFTIQHVSVWLKTGGDST